MAQFVENMGNTHSGTGLAGLFARFSRNLRQRKVYKSTYRELSQLSTRELDDLGISRSMISRLAHEAAYGK